MQSDRQSSGDFQVLTVNASDLLKYEPLDD